MPFSSEWQELATAARAEMLSYLRLFLRHPILLLAFGPPVLKGPYIPDAPGNIYTSRAHFDYWNLLQVSWLLAIAVRAIYRLVSRRAVTRPGTRWGTLPRESRAVLMLAILLWTLFTISVAYSPGRMVSMEFAFLYLPTLICVFEFLVDVTKDPPNWLQLVIGLRLIYVLLFLLMMVVLPIRPLLVTRTLSYGTRLLGGGICTTNTILPVIAIISAYSFLHSLESRIRAAFCFIASCAGLIASQWRELPSRCSWF